MTTIGQVLVNEILPPKYRDETRTLGSKELEGMLAQLASEDPQYYKDVSAKLMRLGNKAAYESGSTLRLSDILPTFDRSIVLSQVNAEEEKIWSNPKLTKEQKTALLEGLYDKAQSLIKQQTYETSSAVGNPFAMQVKSKARGNQDQLAAMISTPGTYSDSRGRMVPLFIQHSFADGLTPAEYWAGTFGARLGVVSCLTPDTLVLMADYSERRIGDLRPGDMVLGANSEGLTYPTMVTRFFNNGVQPVYEYKFRKNATQEFLTVHATEQHKILARTRKWGSGGKDDPLSPPRLVPLGTAKLHGSDSAKNNYVAQLVQGPLLLREGKQVYEALLLGLMIGDGCTSPTSKYRLTFSCADQLLIDDIKDYLFMNGFIATKCKGGNYNWYLRSVFHTNKKGPHVVNGHGFNNESAAFIWRNIGDCHSYNKRLPVDIDSWSDASVLALIAGIVATDGSFYRAKKHKNWAFSLDFNNKELLIELRRLFELRFGIWCSAIHTTKYEHRRDMHGFTVVHPDSVNKLAALMRGRLPGVKGRLLKKVVAAHATRTPDIGCRIQSKTYLGDMPVVDIEVESPDHMFVLANGLISSNSKFSTRKGGYLGKLLSQASADEVVTEDDCGGAYGMPVKADDNDNIGAVLQRDTAGYDAGTVITKEMLADFKRKKIDDIIVRSPVTCGCKDGVCSRCCGIRETGGFPPIGYNLGLNASSALAERITQGALNCLAEGTLVRLVDGTVKPIEQMEAGDMVFGCDTNGNITPTRVVARYDNGIQPCVKTHFLNGEDVVTTEIHKFLTKDFRVVQISECPDLLEVSYKSGELYFNSDFNEQRDVGLQHVYDIEVDHPDHLFLLANGFVCSNTKHSGKKAKGKSTYSGFEAIKNMATVPGTYPDAAAVSTEDGKVESIVDAPQGGKYVYVGGKRHYVAPGYDILVKEGDEVEAGDQISDGVINPVDVVKYKGIGEGRRYFANRFTQMMKDSNYAVNRRNVEAIARTLVNHVQVDDEDAEAQLLPGDIATYSSWSFGYRPREGTKFQTPKQSVGQYLEEPVLHYTIGTKITKKTAEDMARYGIGNVFSNPNPVGVTPVMQSVVKSTGSSGDWMARLGTTYLKTRLTEDAQTGAESHLHSTNPIPGVAKGVEFGNYFDPGVKRPGGYTY